MTPSFPLRRIAAAAWLAFGVSATAAQTAEFALPALPLDQALTLFARQAGLQLTAAPDVLKGRHGAAVLGSKDTRAALAELLAGTGLRGRVDNGVLTVDTTPAAPVTETSLPVVSVRAVADERTTEATRSYAPKAASSATKLDLSLRETPQSVTVMTRQVIEDKALTSVEQVLNHTPGVTMVGDASENSQIFVRGFYLDSGIQIDGLTTTSAQPVYEGSISQGVDPAIADRVEVVKGAAGILAGLGEPSATVNFIRKRPTDAFQAHVTTSVGSWDTRRLEADVSGPLDTEGRVRGRVVAAYKNGNSFMDRYSNEKQVLYGIVDVKLTPQTLAEVAVDHQKSRTNGAYNWNSNPAFYTDGTTFDAGRSYSTGQDWTYWDVDQTSITPSLQHRFDNGWLAKVSYRHASAQIDRVSFYPGTYVDRATNAFVDAWSPTYADRDNRGSRTDSLDVYGTGPVTLFGRRHDVVGGLTWGRNTFSMNTRKSLAMDPYLADQGTAPEPGFEPAFSSDNTYRQTQSGVYGTVRLNIADPFKLMLGARVSNWRHEREGAATASEHNGIVTPYVGAVVDVSKTASVYASYTSIFRPVTNIGANGGLLDPAEGSNAEAGVKFALMDNRLNVSFAVYQTKEDNYPEWADQGMIDGQWIYRSIDGVKTTGFEAEVSGRVAPGWDLMGGYTHNKAVQADGSRKLTYIPKDVFKVTSSHTIGSALTVGGSVRWQSSSYYPVTVNVATPPVATEQHQRAYTLVDLMARYRINSTLSAGINLNNVFDQSYYRSMWGSADYGEPRNVSVNLRADW